MGGTLCLPPTLPLGDGASGAIGGALGRRLQHKDSLMDWDGLMDCQGAQRQKEGQEDQEEATEPGGFPPPSCFKVPWSSWPSFWLWKAL